MKTEKVETPETYSVQERAGLFIDSLDLGGRKGWYTTGRAKAIYQLEAELTACWNNAYQICKANIKNKVDR